MAPGRTDRTTMPPRFRHEILDRRERLATGPTPIRDLGALRRGLWLKDEGTIHAEYGGNKVRKLEFLLHGATERVVTIGAAGSHHVLATSVLGSRLGHRIDATAFPRPETRHAREVLHAATARARIHVAPDYERAIALARELAQGSTFLPAGGSSPVGTLGWVLAGLELAEQVGQGLLPEPRRTFIPLGTAGTILGAAIGFRLGGLRTRVVAVRVVPVEWLPREQIDSLGGAVLELLGLRSIAPGDLAIDFDDAALGPGYGEVTSASRHAIERGGAFGLRLEPTYTGKALGAALHADPTGGPDLYWQTHSTASLEPLLAEAPPLPPGLEAMLLPRDPSVG